MHYCNLTPTQLAERCDILTGKAFVWLHNAVLTSMTGISRVIAIVAGDPQNPVLNIMHSVGCHFRADVPDERLSVTGRRRLAWQVRVVELFQPNAGLVSALNNTFGAYHFKSKRTEVRQRLRCAVITMRKTARATSPINGKRRTFTFHHWCSRAQGEVIELEEHV